MMMKKCVLDAVARGLNAGMPETPHEQQHHHHPHHKARPWWWSSSSSLKGRLRSHPLLRRGFFSKSTASCSQGMLLDSRHRRHTTGYAHLTVSEYSYIPADFRTRGAASYLPSNPFLATLGQDIHGFFVCLLLRTVLLSNVDRGLVQLHRHNR